MESESWFIQELWISFAIGGAAKIGPMDSTGLTLPNSNLPPTPTGLFPERVHPVDNINSTINSLL